MNTIGAGGRDWIISAISSEASLRMARPQTRAQRASVWASSALGAALARLADSAHRDTGGSGSGVNDLDESLKKEGGREWVNSSQVFKITVIPTHH